MRINFVEPNLADKLSRENASYRTKICLLLVLTGKSCDDLNCEYYAHCVQTSSGYAECRCPQHTCPPTNAPVCGTNDKSYLNMCVLKMESCNLQKWIRKKDKGLCGKWFLPLEESARGWRWGGDQRFPPPTPSRFVTRVQVLRVSFQGSNDRRKLREGEDFELCIVTTNKVGKLRTNTFLDEYGISPLSRKRL